MRTNQGILEGGGMKKSLVFLCGVLFLLMVSGAAHAELITIGMAQFVGIGSEYNLIWDPDNNGNSVVWLDYSNSGEEWSNQNAWAAGLDSALTINLYAGYSVIWNGSWRLPSTVEEPLAWGYDGSTAVGYNITSSEMGHLYYAELGNKGYYATDGSNPQPGFGLANTGDFKNLIATGWYWSGTEYAANPEGAWSFCMDTGSQDGHAKSYGFDGLAVRSGQVSMAPIPEPAICLLFGVGLLGLAGVIRPAEC